MLLCIATKTKKKTLKKLQNVVIKPEKVIVEWILSAWNNISCETIESHSNLSMTTALDGDKDDQIHCFKPEENPFIAILGDIAEATPTEMLIDEDEEGDKEIDILL